MLIYDKCYYSYSLEIDKASADNEIRCTFRSPNHAVPFRRGRFAQSSADYPEIERRALAPFLESRTSSAHNRFHTLRTAIAYEYEGGLPIAALVLGF